MCVSVSNLVIYYPLNARNERGNAEVVINHSNFLTRFSFEMAFGLKATNSLRVELTNMQKVYTLAVAASFFPHFC